MRLSTLLTFFTLWIASANTAGGSSGGAARSKRDIEVAEDMERENRAQLGNEWAKRGSEDDDMQRANGDLFFLTGTSGI